MMNNYKYKRCSLVYFAKTNYMLIHINRPESIDAILDEINMSNKS